MPTLLGGRKAASCSDRYGEVVLESPESLDQDMLAKGLSRNPRELVISSHSRRNTSYFGKYVNPRVDRRVHGRVFRAVLQLHSTDEGGEPQGFRKEAATVAAGGKGGASSRIC